MMSKHGVVHAQTSVVFDAQMKTSAELEELYGIEIDGDGTVYDPCEMKEFESVTAWAAYMDQVERETSNMYEPKGGKHYYDDED
jgi:hypothetical protein